MQLLEVGEGRVDSGLRLAVREKREKEGEVGWAMGWAGPKGQKREGEKISFLFFKLIFNLNLNQISFVQNHTSHK